jgi:hypothetical protein
VGSGEHSLEFCRSDSFFKLLVLLVCLLKRSLILDFTAEFNQNTNIFSLPYQVVPTVENLFNNGSIPQDCLGRLIVIPKARDCYAGFNLLNILPLAIYVKETPEAWKFAL